MVFKGIEIKPSLYMASYNSIQMGSYQNS